MCGWDLELLILPRPVRGCLCVCLQEFPLLPSPESPEALVPMEFDVATMVKPLVEILTNISRLLLEDLPSSVAPKAPDPVDQGNLLLTGPPQRAPSHPEPQPGPCHHAGDAAARHRGLRWGHASMVQQMGINGME